jgi:hypothetical protein
MISGGVATTPKERRQTRSRSREAFCLQTKHVSGSCQGCARILVELAHIAEGENEGLRILCGECCPCAVGGRNQNGPDVGRRMNA